MLSTMKVSASDSRGQIDSVFQVVEKTLEDVLCVDREEIRPDSRLVEDLGAESIDFLDLSFQIEQKLNVKLPIEEWATQARNGDGESHNTVQALVDYICQIQAAA